MYIEECPVSIKYTRLYSSDGLIFWYKVHSESGPDALRQYRHSVLGLQLWHGLPEEHEEAAASFHHYPVEDLPATTLNGVHIRLLIGETFGLNSPLRTFTQTLYAEYDLCTGQSAIVPEDVEELAVYAVDSKLKVDNEILAPCRLALLTAGEHQINAEKHTRVVFIGGKSLGKRYMWWTFVSSRKKRIQKAMDDWKKEHFGAVYDDNATPAPFPNPIHIL